jgi:uncharacterized protein with FMN-binding domain
MTPFTRAALPALVIGGAAGALLMSLDRPTAPGTVAVDDASPDLTTVAPTTTTTTASTAPDTAATDTADTATACTTVEGPSIDTRFGPVQVAASVSADGTICAVEVIEYPSDDRRSLSINQQAVPTLVEETLSAQSADVDTVSGATYTSNAYRQSLQAILDSVGA